MSHRTRSDQRASYRVLQPKNQHKRGSARFDATRGSSTHEDFRDHPDRGSHAPRGRGRVWQSSAARRRRHVRGGVSDHGRARLQGRDRLRSRDPLHRRTLLRESSRLPVLRQRRLRSDRALHEGHVSSECCRRAVLASHRLWTARALHRGRLLREHHRLAVLVGGRLRRRLVVRERHLQLTHRSFCARRPLAHALPTCARRRGPSCTETSLQRQK
ncbi:MAG: hypothetical protein QOI41_5968 [Myxococcales bacterium]|nr:hypothetical protein [Myxococcales bacterium]